MEERFSERVYWMARFEVSRERFDVAGMVRARRELKARGVTIMAELLELVKGPLPDGSKPDRDTDGVELFWSGPHGTTPVRRSTKVVGVPDLTIRVAIWPVPLGRYGPHDDGTHLVACDGIAASDSHDQEENAVRLAEQVVRSAFRVLREREEAQNASVAQ